MDKVSASVVLSVSNPNGHDFRGELELLWLA